MGDSAVALLGKSMSIFQRYLLVCHAAGRPVVVLLDSDARDEAARVRGELAEARSRSPGDNRVLIATLPEGGKDPADFTREEVMARVDEALGGS